MFDNLVESGSHSGDISRKGSFLLGTIAIYTVIGVVVAVVGILVVDARVDMDDADVTLVAPVPVPVAQVQAEKKPEEQAKPEKQTNVDVRKELIASVDMTKLVPEKITNKMLLPHCPARALEDQ